MSDATTEHAKEVTVMASETLTPPKVPADIRYVTRCPNCGKPLILAPVLACAHCKNPHLLRCFTYTRAGHYVAECVDLDLLAQGDTAEEAIGKLQEAMFGYLLVAFGGDSTKGLVLRPSPLSHRLRYYLHGLKRSFHLSDRHTKHFLSPSKLGENQRLCHS